MKKKKKSVAHIVCTYPPYRGGMGKVAMENAKQAVAFGYQTAVFTPKYKYLKLLPIEKTEDNIIIRRLKPWLEFGNAALLPTLVWELRKYNILHLHYPFYGATLFVVLAKIFYRKKLIVHYHMDSIATGLKGFIFSLFKYLILPQVLKIADKIIVHSEDYALHCKGNVWLRFWQNKWVVVPNGVNTDFYLPKKTNNNKTKSILFVGALDKAHYFKGLDVLIEAVSELQSDDYHLNIIGNGDMVDYYKRLVKQYKLIDKVSFHHGCNDDCLRRFYQESYVTVLPSTTSGEAFGIVLIESLACGTPVIASNLPGVRNIVDNDKAGLIIKPKDIENLRTRLDYLLSQESMREEMSQYGLQMIKEKYSWQSIGKKINSLYENLLSK